LVFSLCAAALAKDPNLEKQLTGKYKGEVLSLRHPSISEKQNYSLDGEPLTGAGEGPWTLYARLRIEQIAAGDKELRIKGTRMLCEFTQKGLKLIRNKQKVTISVPLNRPLASEDEAAAVLGRVFALTPEEIVSSAPDFWRDYLKQEMLGGPAPVRVPFLPKDQPASNPGAGSDAKRDAKEVDAKEKLFHLGEKNVTAPKPQYTPEPGFTDAARKERYQGVVGLNIIIDPEGRVRGPRIVHALGMGLDESAIETVSKWRFAPATRDGQPVSVAVYIEVDYHLY
jgi:TonB family protein